MHCATAFRVFGKLAVGLSFGLAALASHPASATVMDYSLDAYVGSGSTALVSSPYGTVELNNHDGPNVTVTVVLSAGVGFVNTGAGYSLTWDLQGGPTITVPPASLTPGFSLLSSSAGALAANASGSWDYAITCANSTCGHGGNAPYTGTLSFVVDGVGLSDFIANGSNNYFSADVCLGVSNGTCGPGGITGSVVANNAPSTSEIPEPASIAILSGALGTLSFFRRRTRAQ